MEPRRPDGDCPPASPDADGIRVLDTVLEAIQGFAPTMVCRGEAEGQCGTRLDLDELVVGDAIHQLVPPYCFAESGVVGIRRRAPANRRKRLGQQLT